MNKYELDRDEHGLTKRQRVVLQGLLDGDSQPQIAERLGVTKQRVYQIVHDLKVKGVIKRKPARWIENPRTEAATEEE